MEYILFDIVLHTIEAIKFETIDIIFSKPNENKPATKIRQDFPQSNSLSIQRRMQLVELVVKSNKSISKAAKMLSIKLSTAKLIVKRWRDDGTFFQSKANIKLSKPST